MGLKLEHDADTDVEAAEIVGHCRNVERRARMGRPWQIAEGRRLARFIFWDDLLQEPVAARLVGTL